MNRDATHGSARGPLPAPNGSYAAIGAARSAASQAALYEVSILAAELPQCAQRFRAESPRPETLLEVAIEGRNAPKHAEHDLRHEGV
jgi:hypothetical protein